MKVVAYLLGIVFIVIGVMYFLIPANSLPAFFPGYDPELARTHLKHAIASGIVGVVLLVVGWYLGRHKAQTA
jgi:hypothetical protein